MPGTTRQVLAVLLGRPVVERGGDTNQPVVLGVACTEYGGGEQMPIQYHPDPEIDAGVAADVLEAEIIDLQAGYPPRKWACPDCGKSHSRGHFQAIGTHRCLWCGYVGTGGVMFDETEEPPVV